MDVLTKSNNWMETQLRPTEDLVKVWKTRDLEIWSEDLIHDVQEVLISRHILNLKGAHQDVSWREILELPVIETISVYQIGNDNQGRKWSVNLLEDRALFNCEETGEVFSIDRKNSQKEIIFQRSGIFLQNDSGIALIQGKTFDFSANKKNLMTWIPEPEARAVREKQQRWGIILLIAGAFSLLLSLILNPIWGSALIGLGLMNLFMPGKTLLVLNGISLIGIGTINVYAFFERSVPKGTDAFVGLAFSAGFGVCLLLWGLSELRKYQKLIRIK